MDVEQDCNGHHYSDAVIICNLTKPMLTGLDALVYYL